MITAKWKGTDNGRRWRAAARFKRAQPDPYSQSAIGHRPFGCAQGFGGQVGNQSLVVLDVDGVIFPDQFMIALARRRGIWSFALTVTDCLLFNLGRIGLEELLRRSFGRLKGMPWETVCEVFRGMAIAPHAAETIAELKAAGRQVILLTAGVPDPFVKDLAAALGADGGAGTLVEVKGGRLTGGISGALARTNSKREFVARLIEREGIPWSGVVAVGDDPNNLLPHAARRHQHRLPRRVHRPARGRPPGRVGRPGGHPARARSARRARTCCRITRARCARGITRSSAKVST